MRFFAIRHKPSGKFMPEARMRRGYTWIELEEFTDGSVLPRLCETAPGAKRALSSWLKGAWTTHTSTGGLYGEEYDSWSEPPKVPPEDRKSEDMEIVEFRLVEVKAQRRAA